MQSAERIDATCPLPDSIPTSTTIVAKHRRSRDLEVFGSIRRNDTNDAQRMPFPELRYPLKVKHPELLIGAEAIGPVPSAQGAGGGKGLLQNLAVGKCLPQFGDAGGGDFGGSEIQRLQVDHLFVIFQAACRSFSRRSWRSNWNTNVFPPARPGHGSL